MTQQRLHTLDALRGVAALAVVFWHWQHFFFVGTSAAPTFNRLEQPMFGAFRVFYLYGDLAVDLFFLLSGFVFFWLYGRDLAAHQVGPWRFVWLRFSRLYPLHLVTLCLVAIGQYYLQASFGEAFVYPCQDAWHLLLNAVLLPSVGLERCLSYNAPVWSVSVEVVLYAGFFLICWLGLGRPVVLLAVSALGFVVLSRYYVPLSRGVGSFFLGGVVFAAYDLLQRYRTARRFVTPALALVACAGWCVVFLRPLIASQGFDQLLSQMPARLPLVTLFPVTILSLALLESEFTWVSRGSALLAFLGDISFSSYLWHFPLQLVLIGLSRYHGWGLAVFRSPWTLAIFFAVLLCVSIASYRYLEMPAQRLLRTRVLGRR